VCTEIKHKHKHKYKYIILSDNLSRFSLRPFTWRQAAHQTPCSHLQWVEVHAF